MGHRPVGAADARALPDRRAPDDRPRPRLPAPSRADPGRVHRALRGAGPPPCARDRPHHRHLGLHGGRSRGAARRSQEPDHRLPAGAAGLAGPDGAAVRVARLSPVRRDARAEEERRRPARGVRPAGGAQPPGPAAGAGRADGRRIGAGAGAARPASLRRARPAPRLHPRRGAGGALRRRHRADPAVVPRRLRPARPRGDDGRRAGHRLGSRRAARSPGRRRAPRVARRSRGAGGGDAARGDGRAAGGDAGRPRRAAIADLRLDRLGDDAARDLRGADDRRRAAAAAGPRHEDRRRRARAGPAPDRGRPLPARDPEGVGRRPGGGGLRARGVHAHRAAICTSAEGGARITHAS